MFENELEICKAFNMTPFEVRRERFSEFILLIKRMKTYKPQKEKEKVTVPVVDTVKVIKK